MLSPYSCPSPTLLTRTFSPRAGARAQRQAAIYLSGNENEHTVENVGLGARFLDPLIYVMKLNFELNSSCCTHGGFSCGPGFQPHAGLGLYGSRYCSRCGLLYGSLNGSIYGLLYGYLYGLLYGLLYDLLYGLLRSLRRALLYGLLYGLLYDLLYGLPRDLLYGPAAVDKQPVQPVQPGINSATLTPSHSWDFPVPRSLSASTFRSEALINS